MERQKPPKSVGHISGFPYDSSWEEFVGPGGLFHLDGLSREIIDRNFERAAGLGATYLCFRKLEFEAILAPLQLGPGDTEQLVDTLYYLAGHYRAPQFRKLFKDSPPAVRERMSQISKASTKLASLLSQNSWSVERYLRGVRLKLAPERLGNEDLTLELKELRNQIADLGRAAETIAQEMPLLPQGTSVDVLLGRWLRQSAAAIENAAHRPIVTKESDSTGAEFRFEGVVGEVFRSYCVRVNKGLFPKTMVRAVREYHEYGIGGAPL